jgi:hypothetical protein
MQEGTTRAVILPFTAMCFRACRVTALGVIWRQRALAALILNGNTPSPLRLLSRIPE